MRTYTVRRARTAGPRPEIDIDFVIHGAEGGRAGSASSWAATAEPGDRIKIIGPNRRSGHSGGIEWRPPVGSPENPVEVLLVGDETAVPAVCSVLESLPVGYHGHAVLEVPRAEDFQPIETAADIEVTWLSRGARRHGELLDEAVVAAVGKRTTGSSSAPRAPVGFDSANTVLWERAVPASVEAGFYAWVAGEAGTVRALRRRLVHDLGLDRSNVAFMGYWRKGRSAAV